MIAFLDLKTTHVELHEEIMQAIARGATIGAGAVLLPGITFGSRAVVGACAVVTKNVPSGKIVIGNAARIIGEVVDVD